MRTPYKFLSRSHPQLRRVGVHAAALSCRWRPRRHPSAPEIAFTCTRAAQGETGRQRKPSKGPRRPDDTISVDRRRRESFEINATHSTGRVEEVARTHLKANRGGTRQTERGNKKGRSGTPPHNYHAIDCAHHAAAAFSASSKVLVARHRPGVWREGAARL